MPRTNTCAGKDADGTRCVNPTMGRFCPIHEGWGGRFGPGVSSPVYQSRRWRKVRERVINEWVRAHGWTCPGWRRTAHPASRLQVDHVIPLVAGGAPYDPANLRPLCAGCNARKSLHDRHQR